MTTLLRDASHPGLNLDVEVERVLTHFRTEYQEVLIGDTAGWGRALFLDGLLQSSEFDEQVYHSALVHPAMFAHPAPKHVLIGGGGEGGTLRSVLMHPSVEKVTMVDIDGEAVAACKEYLGKWHEGTFDDPRTELIHDDVRVVLRDRARRFDVIISDLSDPAVDGPAQLAFTQEFFQLCADSLSPGGTYAMQAGEFEGRSNRSFCSMMTTLREAFANVLPYKQSIPSFMAVWGFLVASGEPLEPRFASLAERWRGAGGTDWQDYDPDVHAAMFHFTKRQREMLARGGRVLTEQHTLAEG